MFRNLIQKWCHKFRDVPSLAAIANKEEGQMLVQAALDDSIKQVTVQGKTYKIIDHILKERVLEEKESEKLLSLPIHTEPPKRQNNINDCIDDGIDDAIDIIFNFVDWMLLNRQFLPINYMLAYLYIDKMHTALIIAFLTITAAAKDNLPNRQGLFDRANRILVDREGEQKTKRLLDGLE